MSNNMPGVPGKIKKLQKGENNKNLNILIESILGEINYP